MQRKKIVGEALQPIALDGGLARFDSSEEPTLTTMRRKESSEGVDTANPL